MWRVVAGDCAERNGTILEGADRDVRGCAQWNDHRVQR